MTRVKNGGGVLPVERVVGEDLELGVRDVPVLVRGAFVKNLLVLYYVANLVLSRGKIITRNENLQVGGHVG